jgi:hypothetical protein
LFIEQSADNVLKVNGKWTRFERTISFIDLWNIFIQVKGCHEGTRLFSKGHALWSKTNCLILSTNLVIDGWDHFVNRCLFMASLMRSPKGCLLRDTVS